MAADFIIFIYYFMYYTLVCSAIVFLISGFDDLFFDVFYWLHYLKLALTKRLPKPLVYSDLIEIPEKRIAIMTPCWHEAGVIEDMLVSNVDTIDYHTYDFFVGVYQNDPHTVKAVESIASQIPRVHAVIGPIEGPTTKAQNLNVIFAYIMDYEKKNNVRYDIFILQDAEDIIHPISLRLYNLYIPPYHMVQTPVLPIEAPLYEFLQWIYAAEFSEIHAKEMYVREAINALIPSAGVGTGFSRIALEKLASLNAGLPFEIDTVTEDYSTALNLKLLKLRCKFVLAYYYKTFLRKKYYFFGLAQSKKRIDFIATREIFPHQYSKAIKQRSRWILGIAIQEWQKRGWAGDFATVYTLIHDRKSLLTYVNAGLMLILMLFWPLYSYFVLFHPEYPTLHDSLTKESWLWYVILIDTALMFERILQRAIALYRIYGLWPMILTPILVLYGNLINMHAVFRAYRLYFYAPKELKTGTVKWDKTDHFFPQRALIKHVEKLGRLVFSAGYAKKEDLVRLFNLQGKTGKRLGQLLIENNYITEAQLSQLLAKQYNLEFVSKDQYHILPKDDLRLLPLKNYNKLIMMKFLPVKLDGNLLSLGITDPADQLAITAATDYARPYDVKFVVLEP